MNIFNFYGPVYGDIIGFTNADEDEVENIIDTDIDIVEPAEPYVPPPKPEYRP